MTGSAAAARHAKRDIGKMSTSGKQHYFSRETGQSRIVNYVNHHIRGESCTSHLPNFRRTKPTWPRIQPQNNISVKDKSDL